VHLHVYARCPPYLESTTHALKCPTGAW
jgi:hypothetical protein